MKSIKCRQFLRGAMGIFSLTGFLLLVRLVDLKGAEDAVEAALSRGHAFLAEMIDPDLDLLPEYHGSKVYWLYHDNYLAARVLKRSHPTISQRIEAAIKREGVSGSGKIELLFGELKQPLPFRQFDLIEVHRIGEKSIRTEVIKDEVTTGWQN